MDAVETVSNYKLEQLNLEYVTMNYMFNFAFLDCEFTF